MGKKEALAWGIKHASGDLLLLSDSDGELEINAVEELKKPFDNPKVGTVCGQNNGKKFSIFIFN